MEQAKPTKLTYSGQEVQALLDKIKDAGILTPGEREMLEKMADGCIATEIEMGLMSPEHVKRLDEIGVPMSEETIDEICVIPD